MLGLTDWQACHLVKELVFEAALSLAFGFWTLHHQQGSLGLVKSFLVEVIKEEMPGVGHIYRNTNN